MVDPTAVAQQDIAQYYDSLSPVLLVEWLQKHGASETACACILRHQMLPRVRLQIGNVEIQIRDRSSGTLTGSRVAGMLGRVPVESVVADRHVHWLRWGYPAETCTLTVSTYVDNLFSASRSLHGAISILENFE